MLADYPYTRLKPQARNTPTGARCDRHRQAPRFGPGPGLL